MTIAVLITTFNRKQKTIDCLESLRCQVLPNGVNMEIFLTDDASADGTFEAVQEHFPEVHVYKGTGSLYWAGGMRYTWRNAMAFKPDFYLLLNDDTLLIENAIETLLNISMASSSSPALSIGATCDTYTGRISYGGWRLRSKNYWKGEMIHSHTSAIDCDFGNANLMLVPSEIVEELGILAGHYTHALADYDYSLKAKKAGFPVKTAPGFLGTCVNDHKKDWKSGHTTLKERIEYLKSPKGLSYREYLRFIKDHFPLSYPGAFCKLWLKTFFPFIWDLFKKPAL